MKNGRECDEALRRLWRRCADGEAGAGDWTALYRLVRQVLCRCNAPELAGLSEPRETCVDEYFSEKVFLPMRPGLRGPDHCGALVVFFRRYLRDKLSASRPPSEPVDETSSIGIWDAEALRDLDRVLIQDCKMSTDDVSASAKVFLAELRAEQVWAWQLLRHGFCPDPDVRIPLVRIAQARKIPSYHYRAGRLGINHQWEDGLNAFRGTMIGQWLEDTLGCAIADEFAEAIRAALEILCFEALTYQEDFVP